MDHAIWACPVCYSDLAAQGDTIRCVSENRFFSRLQGLPVLVRPEQQFLLRDAQSYASAWKQTKWAPHAEEILELPFVRRSGWRQKAQSFRELLEILGSSHNRNLVDVGAGTGWLSFRLAQTGFLCFAIDISSDSEVGLGAATQFDASPNRFERALATLDRWPIHSHSVDIAICNASLHYLADFRLAIAEAARVLRSSGQFIIMNSPVHQDSESARRAAKNFRNDIRRLGASGEVVESHQHLVASDLEDSLRDRFVDVVRHDLRHQIWFKAARRLKSLAVGIQFASFPTYVARAP